MNEQILQINNPITQRKTICISKQIITMANPDIRADVRLEALSFPLVRKSLFHFMLSSDNTVELGAPCVIMLVQTRRPPLTVNQKHKFNP